MNSSLFARNQSVNGTRGEEETKNPTGPQQKRKRETRSGRESTNSSRETFCKPKFGNFDGNGPRPGERCETKWPIFAKIHPNVRLEGPGTEQNFRFGSGWPVRVCPCGHVLRQIGIAGRRKNFCSFCLFFSYVIIFEIVDFHSVDIVFSSVFSRLLRNHRFRA